MTEQIKQSYSENEKQSKNQLALFTSIWLITTALLAFGPKLVWDFNATLTIISVIGNLTAGGLMIFANIKHLNSLDELGRKIFLDSAAITLGVLIVFGVCYELVFFTGYLIEATPRISHLYFIMGCTFILSTYLGHRKYR